LNAIHSSQTKQFALRIKTSLPILLLTAQSYFVYGESMNVESAETRLARIAGAIAEPARTRILCCLMDGHARTSTELAVVAEVSPSTASVHLGRLKRQQLVKVIAQGKHRYYSLASPEVAGALEALMIVAGETRAAFAPATPVRLRAARTCYDHMAGKVAVLLHDRFWALGWFSNRARDVNYSISDEGATALGALGIQCGDLINLRRRFAYACLDWSERRPHLGGALGAAVLKLALQRKWLAQDLDSRALSVTPAGRRELLKRFGLQL
jgi:DNA-binding transcriptional ArsR family regulator